MERCPFCKNMSLNVTKSESTTKFWNNKCIMIKKICKKCNYYYVYEEKIHVHEDENNAKLE